MREKAVLVLESLLEGCTVEIDGYKWQLSSDYKLCSIAYNQNTGEKVLLNSFADLSSFIIMCNELTDEEVFLIGANTTLNRIHRGRKCIA